MKPLQEASPKCMSKEYRTFEVFRIGWFLFAGLCWLLVAYVASHESSEPDLFGRYSWKAFVYLCVIFFSAIGVTLTGWGIGLKRVYKQRRTIGLFLASSSICLIGVELGIRLMDPLGISYYEEAGRYHLDKVADADLVYRHRTSWESNYQGVDVRFNEFGLRDEPIPAKNDSEFRILLLGDSVTFGWGVEQRHTFSSRLQALLTEKFGRPVRVINTGVGGYNTVQESTYLKKQGLSFKPNLVLLVYGTNDIEENKGPFDPWTGRSFKGKTPPEVFTLLLGRSWLYRLAAHAYEYGRLGANQSASDNALSSSEGWKGSMKALREIVEICDSQRIPLGVFFFRWQSNSLNSMLLADVKEAVAPIPVIDMSQWFDGVDLRNLLNSQVDSHPNDDGHRVIAERMSDHLIRYKFLLEP